MKDIRCIDCANLVDDWCDKIKDSPDESISRECQYFRQNTNRDVLNQMDNHDLAVFLCNVFDDCDKCPGTDFCVHGAVANGLIKWLDAPAKNGELS